jgi:hypothetical protein
MVEVRFHTARLKARMASTFVNMRWIRIFIA